MESYIVDHKEHLLKDIEGLMQSFTELPGREVLRDGVKELNSWASLKRLRTWITLVKDCSTIDLTNAIKVQDAALAVRTKAKVQISYRSGCLIAATRDKDGVAKYLAECKAAKVTLNKKFTDFLQAL